MTLAGHSFTVLGELHQRPFCAELIATEIKRVLLAEAQPFGRVYRSLYCLLIFLLQFFSHGLHIPRYPFPTVVDGEFGTKCSAEHFRCRTRSYSQRNTGISVENGHYRIVSHVLFGKHRPLSSGENDIRWM